MTYKRRSPMPVVEGGTGAQTLTGVLTGNGTSAITANAVTQYNVIVGGASNSVGSVAPSATTGVPLVSQGAAANPAFGTAVVAGGGTGIVTTTAYAPICGGTTATGAFQAASTGLSTSGFVLTSNGNAALPSWQALPASGVTTIDGDTGSVTGSTVSIKGNGPTGAGQTVKFSGSGTAMSLAASDVSNNTLIGLNTGTATPGSNNTGVGAFVLNTLDGTGTDNTALGVAALRFLTSGDFNTAIGDSSLGAITSGSRNTCIGFQTAGNYTSSEGSNILIGFQTLGTAGESNKLRIGNGTGTGNGNLNAAYISGITGITTGGASAVTMIDSSNQIGTVPGGAVTLNTGTQSLSLSSDASATTVNVGTGAAVKTVTLGSTNSTSATTVQSGSGALNVTSTNGAMTINSGTGALSVSSDASATTVNLATGAAAKTVTLGSTNSTSSTAIKSGSGNVAINSGFTVDSSGRNYNTVQPAFTAYLSSSVANVTGDGTTYKVIFGSTFKNQGSYYNTGTGEFVAPITGVYQFNCSVSATSLDAAHTNGSMIFVADSINYYVAINNPYAMSSGGVLAFNGAVSVPMTAGSSCYINFQVSNGTKVVDLYGVASPNAFTLFTGYLVC